MTTMRDLQSQIDALTAIVERQGEQLTNYVGPLLAGLVGFEEDSVLTGAADPQDVEYIARQGSMYAYGQRVWYHLYRQLDRPHMADGGSLEGDIEAERERQAKVAAQTAQIDAAIAENSAAIAENSAAMAQMSVWAAS